VLNDPVVIVAFVGLLLTALLMAWRVRGALLIGILATTAIAWVASIINPALRAGLNAVFIPHEHTWRLEKEEVVPAGGRLLILQRFGELRAHF